MAQNKILPWAQTGTANVLSDADYASDVASGGLYADGVKTGQASSQQANKTWRQATAPGSGLGQFLVDNLSVDVTDADTPATFSSRIANAVLKLAQISPFNQSWATATGGYRKYAIVSDTSGNFWVSTADQNLSVPGTTGATWQSLFNGLASLSGAAFTGAVTVPTPADVPGINTGKNAATTKWVDDNFLTKVTAASTYAAIQWVRENYAATAYVQENYALQSQLPLPSGMHSQVFTTIIPVGTPCGFNQSPYVIPLPKPFTTFVGALAGDGGLGIFTISCGPRNNSQVNVWFQSPQYPNGPTAGDVSIIITAYGYY